MKRPRRILMLLLGGFAAVVVLSLLVSAGGRNVCAKEVAKVQVDPNTGQEAAGGSATVHKFVDKKSGIAFEQAVPPANWQPASATDAELAYYGFPPRPSDPAGLEAWRKGYSNFAGFAASGACQGKAQHGPLGAAGSHNWTGFVAVGHNDYSAIQGRVTVPHTTAGCRQASDLSIWAGLGGYDSGTLIQNGVADESAQPNQWKMWFEVRPFAPFNLKAEVAPGQIVDFLTSYHGGSAVFFWHNYTSGRSSSVRVANASSHYSGASAELIVERGGIKQASSPNKLFDLRQWDSGDLKAVGLAATGTSALTGVGAFPYYQLNMVNEANQPIAHTSALSPDNAAEFTVAHDPACG